MSDVEVSRSRGGFWRMARTITNINQPAKRLNLPAVNYLQLILPDFSLIICGYLICRYTKLDRTVWGQVDSLVYFFLFPVLLFQSITRYPLALDAASQFMMAGVSLAICGIALAYSVPYWPFVKKYIDPRDHAGSAQIGFRFNSFIALAVSQKLLGDNGLAYMAILIGVSVPIFNIAAVWPMAKHGQQHFGRELIRNPLIWGTTAGLLANIAGFTVPDWMAPSVTRVGQAGLVLGLMAAGAGMQLSALPRAKVLAASMLSVRHFAMPVVAFIMAKMWGLDSTQTTTLLLFSALPTASTCYVLAARMGYNGPYVSSLVTASTAMAVLSLSFALSFLANAI
jgi:malonate transporter